MTDVLYLPDTLNKYTFDVKDKESVITQLTQNMLERTNTMFKWSGLPDTIPQHVLEFQLQNQGYTCFIKHEGKYFVSYGGIGGYRNYNYLPNLAIIANPYLLNGSKNYKVYYCEDDFVNSNYSIPNADGDCVIIQNDTYYKGLVPLCTFYASQLAENLLTTQIVNVMSRATYVYAAASEDDKNDFNDFIKALTDGEYKAILSNNILKKAETLPISENGHKALTDLIEHQQYLKASWLNDLGLQANYNMKRESLNSNESQLNRDAILPFVDTMLAQRKIACDRINKLFGLNLSVDFNSAWKYTRDIIEQSIDAIDKTSEMKMTEEDEVDKSSDENDYVDSQGEKDEDN